MNGMTHNETSVAKIKLDFRHRTCYHSGCSATNQGGSHNPANNDGNYEPPNCGWAATVNRHYTKEVPNL